MNMELDHVVKFLQGKTILVTGATGFLAKSKTMLVTGATGFLAKMPGDISSENLGVNESKLREQMLKEIEIVVHVAAMTGFNERYDVALAINTFGAFNALNFAKKCDAIKLFLHTSTAYVCGEQVGIILEKPFSMDDTLLKTFKLDITEEKRIVEEKLDELRFQHAPNEVIKSEMMEFGLKRAKLYGWPNTYVFTKAMGEMLLGNFKGDLPLVIIRPTMIASTYKEPFPGWIEGVIAVPGDISSENLGVNESKLREQMLKEIEIVVHVAATTGFNERYDVALAINTFGAFNALNFAKKCDAIKLFLHTSTAYVCGEQVGIILEKPFSMDDTLLKTCKLDITEEKRIVEEKLDELRFQHAPNEVIKSEMMEFGLKRAKLYGWPNTYVFTKAMGEMLLGNFKGDLPLVIIRPTMIASTYKEPFPGWIEGVRTIDSVIVSYGKGKLTCFPGYPSYALDVIPADMVV
ncbi:Fatty acyl-coenzyme A reductase, partial [Theobroma cacao]